MDFISVWLKGSFLRPTCIP